MLDNHTTGETGKPQMPCNDHDLLVRVDTNIETIKEHLATLNGRVARVERSSQDHETRVTVIEKRPSPMKMIAWFGGIITLINGVIAYVRA